MLQPGTISRSSEGTPPRNPLTALRIRARGPSRKPGPGCGRGRRRGWWAAAGRVMTSLQADTDLLLAEESAGGPDALQCAESAAEQVPLRACASATMDGHGLPELAADLTLQRLGRALQSAEASITRQWVRTATTGASTTGRPRGTGTGKARRPSTSRTRCSRPSRPARQQAAACSNSGPALTSAVVAARCAARPRTASCAVAELFPPGGGRTASGQGAGGDREGVEELPCLARAARLHGPGPRRGADALAGPGQVRGARLVEDRDRAQESAAGPPVARVAGEVGLEDRPQLPGMRITQRDPVEQPAKHGSRQGKGWAARSSRSPPARKWVPRSPRGGDWAAACPCRSPPRPGHRNRSARREPTGHRPQAAQRVGSGRLHGGLRGVARRTTAT